MENKTYRRAKSVGVMSASFGAISLLIYGSSLHTGDERTKKATLYITVSMAAIALIALGTMLTIKHNEAKQELKDSLK